METSPCEPAGAEAARNTARKTSHERVTAGARRPQSWCPRPGFLTKNTGSPNGEKAITFTFTGRTPRCRAVNSLGDTLESRLLPWPITP